MAEPECDSRLVCPPYEDIFSVAMIERLRTVAVRATAFLAASDGVATFAAHVELERSLAQLQSGDLGE